MGPCQLLLLGAVLVHPSCSLMLSSKSLLFRHSPGFPPSFRVSAYWRTRLFLVVYSSFSCARRSRYRTLVVEHGLCVVCRVLALCLTLDSPLLPASSSPLALSVACIYTLSSFPSPEVI